MVEGLLSNNYGIYSLEYERALTDHLSAYVSPAYVTFGMWSGLIPVTGFGASAGLRYFREGQAPRGLWIAANLHARSLAGKAGISGGGMSYIDVFAAGAGVMGGYTLLIGDVVDVSLGVGAGGNYVRTNQHVNPPTERINPVVLLRLNVGVAF